MTHDDAAGPDWPRYDELPSIDEIDLPHSWDVFPNHLGTLNFISGADVVRAAREVRDGQVIRLDRPINEFDPPIESRGPARHEVFEARRNVWDDKLDHFFLQGSSQWDSLRHIRAREFGFYGGLTDAASAGDLLGIDKVAERGVVGRGVLIDVARELARSGHEVSAAEELTIDPELLDSTLLAAGTEVRPGDIVCIRTGWMADYLASSAERRSAILTAKEWPGVASGPQMARWLWDHRVSAVAADNPAVEQGPGDPAQGWLHRRLIPGLGFTIGELLDFESLADNCDRDGRWTFMFAAAPLYLRGGVGSPANAVAIR